jgi:hypothetical protein
VVAHRDLRTVNTDLDLSAERAPLGRVVEQVRNGSLDRGRSAVHKRGVEVRREGDVRPVPPGALDSGLGNQVEPDVLRLLRVLLGARELDQLRDQRRHLAELLDHVAEKPLPLLGRKRAFAGEHLDVRAQAGERRAQLVRRVRHELALGATRLLERAKHRVEARREPSELVLAPGLDPLRKVAGLRHVLRGVSQAPHRSQRRLRNGEPEPGRNRDTAEGDQDQEDRHAVQRVVHLTETPRDL